VAEEINSQEPNLKASPFTAISYIINISINRLTKSDLRLNIGVELASLKNNRKLSNDLLVDGPAYVYCTNNQKFWS
jgi:hypothetical protein